MSVSPFVKDGTLKPALVPYLRVSTDDKGQDPKRQLTVIMPWADREGFVVLSPEIDEGMSGSKVPALDRPQFLKACERAEAAGAAGLVLEGPDRFSRMDPMKAVWEMVEVKERYKIDVFFACIPRDFQSTPYGRLMIFLQMASAHQWVVDHTAKVTSGMAGAKLRGARFGRKKKKLTGAEIMRVKQLRKEGHGWEHIAVLVNEHRGTLRLTDKAVALERGVSSGSLRRMAAEGDFGPDETLMAQKSDVPNETPTIPRTANDRQNEVVTSGPEGSP